MEEMKKHLQQAHGVHEAPPEVSLAEDERSYGPGMRPEKLEALHRQHHHESADVLTHTHPDLPNE
jgi:hypothetical protein